MKKIKYVLTTLLIVVCAVLACGCYFVSAQTMNKLQGTYKLTRYTRTPKYERKEGYTPTTINYVEDEDRQYEDYLVITGSGMGYYVHKDVNTAAYSKEVTLVYEYDAEETSKISYVTFNDAVSVNANSDIHKLGVAKEQLSYSKPGIDYTELITKRKMRTEALSVHWEKVDKATDLSYVEKQLGTVKKYTYEAFGTRGIYELGTPINIETGEVAEDTYQYFYYVIDTPTNAATASVYYALKETPTTQVTRSVSIAHAEDWSALTIDGTTWTIDPTFGMYYYNENEGYKRQLTCVSHEIANEMLQSFIDSRLPTV